MAAKDPDVAALEVEYEYLGKQDQLNSLRGRISELERQHFEATLDSVQQADDEASAEATRNRLRALTEKLEKFQKIEEDIKAAPDPDPEPASQ